MSTLGILVTYLWIKSPGFGKLHSYFLISLEMESGSEEIRSGGAWIKSAK